MSRTKLTFWIIILFATIASSLWYFNAYIFKTNFSVKVDILKHSIDATITDLSVKEYDINGNIENFLEAPFVKHNPKQNTHILTNPHILIKEENKSPWEISAQEAVSINGGKKVTFNKDVVVLQKNNNNTGEICLFTKEITYIPKDKCAFTLSNVKLQQANNTIEATGLKAYLAENRVQLLNNARGHYEQKHV
ncbi:MAG: LPS export ABC transporter periplasmic protein LptC [Legionellales bacterium RIFCSPHIGHO2_12_FULL_35_11]|nr:MAG: LPS export ABC transporter periplasmic protein LptC [Legionellales bacterium RIFCSPHIGHO2_12_FULL_35_11]